MIQHSTVVRVGVPFLLGVLVACAADAPSPVAFGKGISAPGAKLTLLADTFKFTEGPAADKQGNVFFTDQPNNRILEWSVDGKLSTFMSDSGRSNGVYLDDSDKLYACADLNSQVWVVDPATKKVPLLVRY